MLEIDSHDAAGLTVSDRLRQGQKLTRPVPFVGEHNANNACGAFALATALGCTPEQCRRARPERPGDRRLAMRRSARRRHGAGRLLQREPRSMARRWTRWRALARTGRARGGARRHARARSGRGRAPLADGRAGAARRGAGPGRVRSAGQRQAGESLNRDHEQTGGMIDLWTSVTLLLVAAGVRQLAAGNQFGWPLLWWAYRSTFPPGTERRMKAELLVGQLRSWLLARGSSIDCPGDCGCASRAQASRPCAAGVGFRVA